MPGLVGRGRELAVLRDRLAAMLTGRGSLVLIGGEAGIGKTALAEWLCREATAHGALALVGRCYDLSETPPYGPWRELSLGYPPDDALPPLTALLADDDGSVAAGSQAALFGQVLDWCAGTASARPLVVLLDDLHWADPASLDLLRVVARRASALRLLLVVTYRSDELTRRHPLYALLPLLEREAQALRLDLRRLDAEAAAALVAGRYALPAADAARLVAWLVGRAEGNAFFTTQLLRSLEEESVVRAASNGWALGDLTAVGLPLALRQVLDARLARLGEDAQRLLALAAVIGQAVPLALWAAVAETDEEALLDAIERAVNARLLAESPDGSGIRFAHALIREALYEGMLATRRRRIHRRVAEAIAALPDPDPDAVAHHYQQAGDPQAAEWLVRAGGRAERAFALLTAHDRFAAALAVLEREGAGPRERGWLLFRLAQVTWLSDNRRSLGYIDAALPLADAAGDRALRACLQCWGGFLRCSLGQAGAGVVAMESGVADLEALSPVEVAELRARAARGDLHAHYDPRGTLAEWLGFTGRFDRALAVGEAFVATTPAGVTGLSYAEAHKGLAYAHAFLGRPEAARAAFAAARRHQRGEQYYSESAATALHEILAVALPYAADRPAERQALAEEMAGAGRQVEAALPGLRFPVRLFLLPLDLLAGDWDGALARAAGWESLGPYAKVSVTSALGRFARERGDLAAARGFLRTALPEGRATAPGNTRILDTLPLLRLAATLALDAADLPEARAWLETYDRWLAWSGAILGRSEGQALWAQYHRLMGNPEGSRTSAKAALVHATEPCQPLALLAAHRLLGELASTTGDFGTAQSHLDQALVLSDACAAPYERALSLLAQAELTNAQGQRADAEGLLAEVRAICTPLGAKPALARADALAAKLAPQTAPAASYPAGLTVREVDVLRLVAQGLTDAEVAAQLSLSRRTVSSHLTNIYTKLNVTSRTAAARFAVEHDLG